MTVTISMNMRSNSTVFLYLVSFPDPPKTCNWTEFWNETGSYSDVVVTLENWCIHSLKRRNTSNCPSVSTEEVRTKCFSRRLMSGVGNFS